MMIIINGKKKKINDYGQGSALRNMKIQFIPKKKKKKLFFIHSIVGLIVMPTVKSLDPFTKFSFPSLRMKSVRQFTVNADS